MLATETTICKIHLSKPEIPQSLELGINRSSDVLNIESNVGKKAEVRFVNEAQHSNKSDKENVNQIPDSRNTISKEMTKEEYTERMNFKRKLAKEKKLKAEIEREIEKQTPQSDNVVEALTPVDTSITTESEISINILPKDIEVNEIQRTEPIIKLVSMKEEKNTHIENDRDDHVESKKENSAEKGDDSISEKFVNNSVTIEISSEPEKMTASTDELDKLDRKKRLELIMSRVKKTPTGSSENVSQHMTTSALQNMMDKGHLSGMSKTAAVLMRNANRSSELCSSTSDIHSASENIEKPSMSMENLVKINVNPESSKTLPLKGDDESVSRGDCDGKEDSPKNVNPTLETKSNIMQNLSANPEGSYFTSWKEKYSVSDSLDSENDTTEEL